MRERGIGSIREESEEFGSIREAIDWMAETRGEAVFLISAETGRVLTFEGLQQQSRATSARLREAGLEHGDKVAFLMDNGLFTAQLFLGTMYGGFVSVPLNVRAGVSQLSYMLEHCDAKIVFVASQYASLIKEVMTDVRRSIEVISADIDGFYQENEFALHNRRVASTGWGRCGHVDVQLRDHRATERSSPYSQVCSRSWKKFHSIA